MKVHEAWQHVSFDPNNMEGMEIELVSEQICSCKHDIFQHFINEKNEPINCKVCKECKQYVESKQ